MLPQPCLKLSCFIRLQPTVGVCQTSSPRSISTHVPAQDAVPAFWRRVLGLRGKPEMRHHERVSYLLFAIHAFQSLENEAVRGQALQLVSLPTWHALSRGRLQLELHAHPKLAKHWRHAAKKVPPRPRCSEASLAQPSSGVRPARLSTTRRGFV